MMELTYENFYEDYYINKRIGRDKFYKENYPLIIKRNLDIKRVVLKDILNFLRVKRVETKKINVLIWGSKFQKLMNDQYDSFNFFVVTNSLKEYKHFWRNENCHVYLSHRWQALIDKGYELHDLNYTQKAIDLVVDYIKSSKIKLVILGNDKLFIEKLLQYAADKANINTIIIQHGIYNIDSFKVLDTSNTANHFLTWSEYVKDTYKSFYPDLKNDVRVIGYPLEIKKTHIPDKHCVLFLGNQYANYNKEEGEKYLEIAKTVFKICYEKDIDFVYRKHPSEIVNEHYEDLIEYISVNKNLMDDLNRSSIIVGDVSSVMIEAGLVGRHVVQIIWSERSQVGLSDPMYSFTEKSDCSYESISRAIENCIIRKEANRLDDYYLWVNENIKDDFKKIMMELGNVGV